MPNRGQAVVLAVLLLLLAGLAVLLWPFDGDAPAAPPAAPDSAASSPDAAAASLAAPESPAPAALAGADRQGASHGAADTGLRGIVVDGASGKPLAGVDVIAVKDEPSVEPLVARFRGMFQDGMFVQPAPRRELGRTQSRADGTFELVGLPPGRVFLDGRSDGWFVRTPGTARLAKGEIQEGIELRAHPGGRVRGIVLGADGAPVAAAHVSLRPGLNAFLGQLTERKYRWLDTATDEQGRFDLPGVPPGASYTLSASGASIALEEQFGLEVRAGQVVDVTVRGHAGAFVSGRVVDGDGRPVPGANVAMVYLDISRVLFSADGRTEPIVSDAEGRFRLDRVAAGRVAFVAAAQDRAPSGIEELAVVDGGVYEDLELRLGEGAVLTGVVVDDRDAPVAGAAVEIRPFERPDDPQFLKMVLKIRRVVATTDGEGRFTARGITGDRLLVQAGKAGHTTCVRFGVRLDEKDLKLQIQRGATVRGRVVTAEGEPVGRFRVETRSRPPAPPADANANRGANGEANAPTHPTAAADAGSAGSAAAPDAGDPGFDEEQRPGVNFRIGMRGDRDGEGRGGRGRDPFRMRGTQQLPEGQGLMDRTMDGNWREVQSADGTFTLTGIPPGRVRVAVRSDGCLDPERKEIELLPGQTSDELEFALGRGETVQGVVVDAATNQPVPDAQVTAYAQRRAGERDDRERAGFRVDVDPEDFDFLGMSAATGRRSAVTDSKGRFAIDALGAGKYRFTARHPDMAKASAKDVVVEAGKPTADVEIRLDAGGGVEGSVTGLGGRPLADALIVAFSIQAGAMRSGTTDARGFYRIDGLAPGQYAVFKSRLDERADNIPLELLSNMRLKTVTVRKGAFARCDVHDDREDGVRVHGVVREGGNPVPRALVTLLGNDREGLLGMGVRAAAAGMDGRYELNGIAPGSYVLQVSRFQGRPVQTTFEIEVPGETRDHLFDVQLPTSEVAGTVLDSRGRPAANVQVTLGSDSSSLGSSGGLVGLIAQNGLAQGRTGADGTFRLRSVAAGSYRLTAGSRLGGRRGGRGFGGGGGGGGGGSGGANAQQYGEGSLENVVVDGASSVEGLVVTVPLAGKIAGVVVDGSGNPVANVDISCVATDAPKRRQPSDPLLALLGNARPVRSGADGKFELTGLTPGTYDLRADDDALQAGKADGVRVDEDATAQVTLQIVRGATLRLRATNVDRERIPFAQLSLLDGSGKPVVNRVSTLTVMRRLLGSRSEVEDSGWHEFGSVPPDTYTAVIAEPGKPEIRITRAVRDGEMVEWDVDVAAELAAREKK